MSFEDLTRGIEGQIESKTRKRDILKKTSQFKKAELETAKIQGMQTVLDQLKHFIEN